MADHLGQAFGRGFDPPLEKMRYGGMTCHHLTGLNALGDPRVALHDDVVADLHVVPDPQAIWHAIMQNQVVAPVSRPITLKLLATTLKPPVPGTNTQALGDTVMAMQVVFDSGQTANFDVSQTPDGAGFLNQSVNLMVPIESFVLGDNDTNTYRYRIDLVTSNGIKKGTPITDNRDTLCIAPG